MDEPLDVIGVGALNVDRLYLVDRLANAGEEVAIKSMIEAPGGSSANTIAGLARLGVKTGFIGKVGSDSEGEYLLNDFRKENIDVSGIQRDEDMTGVIIGIVDEKGERTLYANPGANNFLDLGDSAVEYANRAKILHFTSFVSESAFGSQLKLLDNLSGVKISFAPGMLYARKGLSELDLFIENTSILFVNESEAEMLTGWDYRRGAEHLIGVGADMVVVTLGDKGCYITTPDDYHIVKPYQVKPVDTTGAGDAFAAGFLYGVLNDEDLETCGRLGNFVAAKSVLCVGAREGLPYKNDLKKF